jgi:protein-S-isoprenylcysteine O-methyltransferase Ste14
MSSMLRLLLSVSATNILACVAVALWVRRNFALAGKLGPLTAICLGVVFYIPVIVTLLAVGWGLDRGSLALPAGLGLTTGLMFMVPGIALIAAGRLTFGSRARVYGMREDELLTQGIYAWSRNPQYFGTFLVLLGAALIAKSFVTLLLACVFLLLIHLYIILVEEPHLSKAFAERYTKYGSETNRYLGLKARKSDQGAR